MFNTYVINLKKDIHRFYKLKNDMLQKNINVIRFDAIYGKDIKNYGKYNKYLSKYCEYFCSRGLIGCALSHYILLNKIYNNYKNNIIKNEYTLILEDDAIPLFDDIEEINYAIENIPNDCDTLLLYCQGSCNYNKNKNLYIKNKNIIGSTVAYIIKNSSIPKFIKNKIIFHVDLQWYNTKNINVYIYNKMLFSVNKNESYNKGSYNFNYFDNFIKYDNTTVSESLNYKVFRIPILNIELTLFEMIIYLIIIIIIICMVKKYYI